MNEIETRKYEMLTRVREFGTSHASAFPSGSIAADLLTQIGATVDRLSSQSATKAAGSGTSREGSASRAKMRDTLRADLEAISRTARAMAAQIPSVDARFRMPPSCRDQTLLDVARAFAEEAAPLKVEFELREMPGTFIDKLEMDIEAFEQALNVQRHGVETRIQAGAAIETTLAAGMNAVRQLDSMVRNKYASDPANLTLWVRSSRVQRTGGGSHAARPDLASEGTTSDEGKDRVA